jgi:hypothetical protein
MGRRQVQIRRSRDLLRLRHREVFYFPARYEQDRAAKSVLNVALAKPANLGAGPRQNTIEFDKRKNIPGQVANPTSPAVSPGLRPSRVI